jgi:hypothetical protein
MTNCGYGTSCWKSCCQLVICNNNFFVILLLLPIVCEILFFCFCFYVFVLQVFFISKMSSLYWHWFLVMLTWNLISFFFLTLNFFFCVVCFLHILLTPKPTMDDKVNHMILTCCIRSLVNLMQQMFFATTPITNFNLFQPRCPNDNKQVSIIHVIAYCCYFLCF